MLNSDTLLIAVGFKEGFERKLPTELGISCENESKYTNEVTAISSVSEFNTILLT